MLKECKGKLKSLSECSKECKGKLKIFRDLNYHSTQLLVCRYCMTRCSSFSDSELQTSMHSFLYNPGDKSRCCSFWCQWPCMAVVNIFYNYQKYQKRYIRLNVSYIHMIVIDFSKINKTENEVQCSLKK